MIARVPELERIDSDYRSTYFRSKINSAHLQVTSVSGGMNGLHVVSLWCMAQGWKEIATFPIGRREDEGDLRHKHAVRAATILKVK